MPLQFLAAPATPAFPHLEMHDLKEALGQFNPLMHPALAHIHALEAAAGAGPGQAGDDGIRGQQLLSGALVIGSGFFGGGSSASFGFLPGRIGLLLGRLKGAVLGRRLVGVFGVAIQAFLQSEIFLTKRSDFLFEGNEFLTQRKVFLTQFVHQPGQPLVFGEALRKELHKRVW